MGTYGRTFCAFTAKSMTAQEIRTTMEGMGDPVRAAHCLKFFKTGPGEYGYGDQFRGITVPQLRKLAGRYRKMPLNEALVLLRSPYHEDRFVALCILVHAFQAGHQQEVVTAYLDHTAHINNWDLVDTSAHKILGPYLFERDRGVLYELARSRDLWERRIAVLTTYYFIKRDHLWDTLALSELLLNDTHELMHKACGWMLRETGKRDEAVLHMFLRTHYRNMPRTMLRYAIERLTPAERRAYMTGTLPPESDTVHPWRAYLAVRTAWERIHKEVVRTPLQRSGALSEAASADVWLKLENLQHTGSFKYRGALSKLTSLPADTRSVLTASTGNHALAVVRALEDSGLDGTIFLPHTADAHKVSALKAAGASLEFAGQDGIEAETEARRVAEALRIPYVSPYNDYAVLGGQGTVGTEVLLQLGRVDCVMASVGGGGLISGVAAAIKAHFPDTRVIGCSPGASHVMHASVRAGRVVCQPIQPTLSDGTAGGVDADAITLPLCQVLVDEWILATESEIAEALRNLHRDHGHIVEGAAGVTLACFDKIKHRLQGLRVVIVVCGGNINRTRLPALGIT